MTLIHLLHRFRASRGQVIHGIGGRHHLHSSSQAIPTLLPYTSAVVIPIDCGSRPHPNCHSKALPRLSLCPSFLVVSYPLLVVLNRLVVVTPVCVAYCWSRPVHTEARVFSCGVLLPHRLLPSTSILHHTLLRKARRGLWGSIRN